MTLLKKKKCAELLFANKLSKTTIGNICKKSSTTTTSKRDWSMVIHCELRTSQSRVALKYLLRLQWGSCYLSHQLHRLRQPVTPLTTDSFKVSGSQSVKRISRCLTTDCFRVSWEVRLLYLGLSLHKAMTEAEAPPSPGAEVGQRINLFIALSV